jgi:hypothetical protein
VRRGHNSNGIATASACITVDRWFLLSPKPSIAARGNDIDRFLANDD